MKKGRHIAINMDYVKGRACKMTVWRENDKLYICNDWYDHSDDDLKELLTRLGMPAKEKEAQNAKDNAN